MQRTGPARGPVPMAALLALAALAARAAAYEETSAGGFLGAAASAGGGAAAVAAAAEEALDATSDTTSEEMAAVARLLGYARLPSNVTEAQQKEMEGVIEEQIKLMQGHLDGLDAKELNGKNSVAANGKKTKAQLGAEKHTHKMRLHMKEFVGNLRKTLRFVKNGALKSDKQERKNLNDVLEKMSVMVGWGHGGFDSPTPKAHAAASRPSPHPAEAAAHQ